MIPKTLPDQVTDLYFRIAEIERRSRNRRRKGVVAEVSEDKSRYRVRLSEPEGKPFLTSWIRPRQIAAGGVKIDVLYQVGEQVDVVSETGDLADAQIDFSTYSDNNGRENADAPLHIKIGDTVIEASAAGVKITGDVAIKGNLDVDGGTVRNDGVVIDKGHKHTDVEPGGGISGPPVA